MSLQDLVTEEPFLRDCIDDPASVDYEMWRALAQTLHTVFGAEEGRRYFHQLSELDPDRYDESETETTFDGAIESLETIGRPIGYERLTASSRWSGTPTPGCRGPAAFLRKELARRDFDRGLHALPADLNAQRLEDILPQFIEYLLEMSVLGQAEAANRLVTHFKGLTKKPLNKMIKAARLRAVRERRDGLEPSDTASTPKSDAGSGFPEIDLTQRQFRDVMEDVVAAVVAGTTPRQACLRVGELARLRGTDGSVKIELLDVDMAYGLAIRSASYFGLTAEGHRVPRTPTKQIGADLRAYPPDSLPVIDGVASNPFFSAAGDLVATPGYHAESRTWLELSTPLPPLLDSPTQADAVAAANLLLAEVLGDFPLVGDADRAHVLAMMLQAPARLLIDGPALAHFVSAPTAGTGKGLLVAAVHAIVAGGSAPTAVLPEKEDEVHKTLVAKTLEGSSWIVFDNIRDGRLVSSPSLASYLTSTVFGGRVLGVSKTVSLLVRSVLVLNGNNISVSTELARRVLSIRLDRSVERPAERGGFKHPDLLRWIRRHRAELQAAVLTMIKAWLAAGRPAPANPVHVGGYESFSAVINGILSFAGLEGFLSNRERFTESADEERQEMVEFVRTWWGKLGDRHVSVRELANLAGTGRLTSQLLPSHLDWSQGLHSVEIKLGKVLKRNRDRVFERRKIGRGHDKRTNRTAYWLTDLERAQEAGVIDLSSHRGPPEGTVKRGLFSGIAGSEPTLPALKSDE